MQVWLTAQSERNTNTLADFTVNVHISFTCSRLLHQLMSVYSDDAAYWHGNVFHILRGMYSLNYQSSFNNINNKKKPYCLKSDSFPL